MKRNNLVITGLASMLALSWVAVFANNMGTPASNTNTKTTMTATAKSAKGFGGMFAGEFGWKWGKWWHGGRHGPRLNTEAQAALTANDYNAFVTAIKGTPMEGNVTQEQFAKMITREAKQKAKKAAIAANDYAAFVKASTPTQEEFNDIVTREKSRISIDAAVQANDYNAFVTAIKGTPMEGNVTQEQFAKMINHRKAKGMNIMPQ